MFELKEGKNCWRRSQIDKGGFILSGQDYFLAFRQALLQAERSVYILAWDIKESIDLVREEGYDDGFPLPLGEFIFALLDARPELEIYILLWDYSMLYIVEREWLPFTGWRRKDHPRLHLETDDAIELGASHHQKVVVVDDSLAFCGGFDLSTWRWDTTDHLAEDPRRTTPKGETYQPYHDVQAVFTGKAAHDLGDLCAYRWQRATGSELPRPGSNKTEVAWPSCIDVDIEETEVGIAFTYSSFEEHEPVFQIRQAHFDAIKAARDYIYIENQYLSSHELTEALIERLQSSEGPEIVMILTKEAGWAEESTMGVIRDRLLEKLIEADTHGRFSVFYPFVENDSGRQSQVYVHAKVLIADSLTLFIGTANLSNRSMKVDSEVNLVFSYQDPAPEIKQLMHRLLAVHLQCSDAKVAAAISSNNSIESTIEEMGQNSRHRLKKLEAGTDSVILRKLGDTQILDPDEPLSPASWMDNIVLDDQEKDKNKTSPRTYVKWGIVLLIGVIGAWLMKSLWGEVIDKQQIISFIEGFRNSSALLPTLVLIFLIGGLVGISINLLLVASTIAVGPWAAFGCGLTGAVISAQVMFWAGRSFSEPIIQKIAPEIQKKISRRLDSTGILPLALIRLVPVAPFMVVNLVAGALKITFSLFLIGTILGMIPGMFAVVLITSQAQQAFSDPQWQHWLILVISLLACGLIVYVLKNLIDKQD